MKYYFVKGCDFQDTYVSAFVRADHQNIDIRERFLESYPEFSKTIEVTFAFDIVGDIEPIYCSKILCAK